MALRETLKKVDELSAELKKLRPISPEQERRIMDKFRLDWNYNSNNLEGNQLSYGETKALLLHGITAQGKPLKDHIEIQGHDEALKYIEEVIKQHRPLTESFIRELHKMILKEPYEVNAITPDGQPTRRMIQIGQYKTAPNHVLTKTGEIFRFATPEETPAKMDDLISWLRGELDNPDMSPVLVAAEFHYRFIRIHPFDDGNGRLVRILMNFILMMKEYPPVIIKTEKKEEYFSALQQADGGNLEAFFDYIGQQLVYSLELMIRGAKGENIEELDDLDKEISLLKARMHAKDNLVEKSRDSLINHYETFLFPFIQRIEGKLSQFDELFQKKMFQFFVGNMSLISIYDFPEEYIGLLTNQYRDLNLDRIIVEFSWDGFKRAGADTFKVWTRVEIYFEEFRWIVKFPAIGKEIKKLYSDVLPVNEINEYVSISVKDVLEQIKSRTGIKE